MALTNNTVRILPSKKLDSFNARGHVGLSIHPSIHLYRFILLGSRRGLNVRVTPMVGYGTGRHRDNHWTNIQRQTADIAKWVTPLTSVQKVRVRFQVFPVWALRQGP